MRSRSISDFSFAILLMMACLVLAASTIILYSDNLEYRQLNRELMIKNDSIMSLKTELGTAMNISES